MADRIVGAGSCESAGDRAIAESLAELLDSSAGIKDLLFASVERMAGRTHFQMNVLAQRGAGLNDVPTTAGGRDVIIFGMDVRFHLTVAPKKGAQCSQMGNE